MKKEQERIEKWRSIIADELCDYCDLNYMDEVLDVIEYVLQKEHSKNKSKLNGISRVYFKNRKSMDSDEFKRYLL